MERRFKHILNFFYLFVLIAFAINCEGEFAATIIFALIMAIGYYLIVILPFVKGIESDIEKNQKG